jgi:hypothetical protein
MAPRIAPSLALLLCCRPADKAPGDGLLDSAAPEDTAAPAPETCEDLDVVEVAVWRQEDLPLRADLRHTMQGVGLGDLDGDGWLDALVAWGGGSFGLRNDGAGNLVLDDTITGETGPLPAAIAVALADLDGDGDLDGILGGWNGDASLLLNDGTGRFALSLIPETAIDIFSVAFGDADADGDLDVFLSAASDSMTFDGISSGEQVGDPNLFLRQEAPLQFVVDRDALPADTLYGMTLHTAFVDADLDGDLDLYVGNDAGPYIDPNLLLKNDGTGHFTRDVDCGCELEMLTMGVAVGDANQDGLPDLYITDVGSPALLINREGAQFYDATLTTGAEIPAAEHQMVSWGTGFLDIDGDRDQDLIVTFGQSGQNFDSAGTEGVDGEYQPDQILLSDGAGRFSRAAVPGFQDGSRTRAFAAGDIDRDGRPDLVTVGKYFVRQWRTVGGCPPGATLRLFGENLVGAQLDATIGGVSQRQWFLPSTAASSNADELYLGFGGYPSAESVSLRAPDGSEVTLPPLLPGARVDVTLP